MTSAPATAMPQMSTLPVAKPRSPRMPLPSLPTHLALPAVSYAGLGGAGAAVIKVLSMAGVSVGASAGLVGMCIGMPVAMILTRLAMSGGQGVAKQFGGVPASPRIRDLAHQAAAAVGVSAPHVYEVPSKEPNAFAASGLGAGDTTVAVTSGLREILNDDELGAVLAHEMGHLRHRDVVRNMHVAAAAAGLGGIYQIGRIFLDSSTRTRNKRSKKDKDDEGGGAALGVALMA